MSDKIEVSRGSWDLALKQRDYRELQLIAIDHIVQGKWTEARDAVDKLEALQWGTS